MDGIIRQSDSGIADCKFLVAAVQHLVNHLRRHILQRGLKVEAMALQQRLNLPEKH